MKYIYILLFSIIIPYTSFSQLEVGAGFASVAISDGSEAVAWSSLEIGADYDIMSDSKIRVAPGINLHFNGSGTVGVAPGVKVGLDIINAKVNYDVGGVLWYGVSSRIPIGDTHGVNISLQGGSVDGFGLGWAMVGYSYKFNL